jgi:hypothetical protein
VEHGDAGCPKILFISARRNQACKGAILEAEGELFRYDQLFNEKRALKLDDLRMIILKKLIKYIIILI